MPGMIADTVLAQVTDAKNDKAAAQVLEQVRSRQVLEVVADLLYIDFYGHGSPWLRREIVKQARH
jgi:hypothetical protein